MSASRIIWPVTIAVAIALVIASAFFYVGRLERLDRDDGSSMTSSNIIAEPVGRLRFLALGDSYTIGESVPPAERWPMQLAALLRSSGVDANDPQIIARTGWTTSELSHAIDAANPQGPFDIVTLLIGVNNQYRGLSLDDERAEFGRLLDRAIAFANGDASCVIVLSIPDWGVTPFAEGRDGATIAQQIDAFNTANAEEATRRGVVVVDITPISRETPADRATVASDGLHPSGQQYAKWATLALPAARQALADR